MLTRIYVDNFRCLVNFECLLGPQQLILGPNGAGKSTLFEVLGLIRDFCIRGESPDSFCGPTRTRWQNAPAQTFELDVTGNGGLYKLSLVMDAWGNPERPRVVKEEVRFSGKPIFVFENGEVHLFNDKLDGKSPVQYPFDWHRSALATITERRDNTKLWWFKRWLDGLLIVQPNPWGGLHDGVASQEATNPDLHLSNFANWYRHLRLAVDDAGHAAYNKDLTDAVAGFLGMRLDPAGDRRHEIKVRLAAIEDDNGLKTPSEYLLKELSEGQRVLIGLYAILHFALKPGATLCFDEPDNFVALREVQPWLTKVLDRTEDEATGAQVLIVSHHPELLNRMAFKEGLQLDRPDGRHARARRFDDPSQTGLTASELIARGWERE